MAFLIVDVAIIGVKLLVCWIKNDPAVITIAVTTIVLLIIFIVLVVSSLFRVLFRTFINNILHF